MRKILNVTNVTTALSAKFIWVFINDQSTRQEGRSDVITRAVTLRQIILVRSRIINGFTGKRWRRSIQFHAVSPPVIFAEGSSFKWKGIEGIMKNLKLSYAVNSVQEFTRTGPLLNFTTPLRTRRSRTFVGGVTTPHVFRIK